MNILRLNPYVNLNGTAGEAIELYKSALGAKVEGLMRFGDIPGSNVSPEMKDRVMHAALNINGNSLMVSDTPASHLAPGEGNVQIALHFDDVTETEKAFEALSAGGKVTQPLTDTFWSARFGMLTDAYGVSWMFNCDLKKQ